MHIRQNTAGLNALVHDPQDGPKERVYRIGDLAREFNITLRTLRFYEDRGLLVPARSGSTRLYSQENRQRLKLILLAKRLGFSLADIECILTVNDQENLTKESLQKLLTKFRGQTSVLDAQRAEIDQAIGELAETIEYLEAQLRA